MKAGLDLLLYLSKFVPQKLLDASNNHQCSAHFVVFNELVSLSTSKRRCLRLEFPASGNCSCFPSFQTSFATTLQELTGNAKLAFPIPVFYSQFSRGPFSYGLQVFSAIYLPLVTAMRLKDAYFLFWFKLLLVKRFSSRHNLVIDLWTEEMERSMR